MIPTLLAFAVVGIAAPLNWYVTFRLWQAARASPKARLLRDRALASLALAVIVTIFAAIFLNNEMTVPLLGPDATKIISRAAMLALSIIPAIHWLRLFRSGR